MENVNVCRDLYRFDGVSEYTVQPNLSADTAIFAQPLEKV
jgi:hypothetical protein